MRLCKGNLVTIRRAVVYYALTANAISAGTKSRHCMQHSESLDDKPKSALTGQSTQPSLAPVNNNRLTH